MAKRRLILLITNASAVAGNAETLGAAAYARRLGTWRYLTASEGDASILNIVDQTPFDGIIGHLGKPALMTSALAHGIPIVALPDSTDAANVPRIEHDHEAITKMAANHLLSLGFNRFTYAPMISPVSDFRQAVFAELIQAAGMRFISFAELAGGGPTDWQDLLSGRYAARALARLELPAAVLAFNDQIAIGVIDAAVELGIRVPEQLAVLGIDNNQVRCEFARVPLSSIDPDLHRVGYEAAALLDRLLSGESPPPGPILIPPRGLLERQSTDVQAFDDPDFAEALARLRAEASNGASVKQVLADLPMGRIRLERACRRYLGRSPAQEMRRVRIELAQRLLADSDLKGTQIAKRCGFEYLSHFSKLFKQETGLSPRDYRARYQKIDPGTVTPGLV